MAQRVRARVFVNAGREQCAAKGALQQLGVEVVAPFGARLPRIDADAGRRKHPLPCPFGGGTGIFAGQREGQLDARETARPIAVERELHLGEMQLQRLDEVLGQHGDAVFAALAIAHADSETIEVEILVTN